MERRGPQLITYADRLGGDLAGTTALLDGALRGAFDGVHVLPFFVPIDGADAGFDPIDHTAVDPRLGGWDDVAALAERYVVTADLIVNHVSSSSTQFRDFLARGDAAPSAEMFLRPERVFGGPPSPADLARIYRPRPTSPFTTVSCADGSRPMMWTTFTTEQIDIDVESPQGWRYLLDILDRFGEVGIGLVRLDAIGYAIKRPGTSCFMLPDTFDFIDRVAEACHERGMETLVEIHGHHLDQLAIASRVDWVYDFALPPLLLDACFTGDTTVLEHWVSIRPNNSINVLDTHDGIGVVDVGADPRDPSRPTLLAADRIDALVEEVHRRSGDASRRATGAAASNLDLYQVNCTYGDALADRRSEYAARAVQVLLPGIAQVYYVGLLGGHNDLDLLARTGVGRDVNRHHYAPDEIEVALADPFVERLLGLLRWRASEPAFDGTFELLDSPPGCLAVRWTAPTSTITATVDLRSGDVDVS